MKSSIFAQQFILIMLSKTECIEKLKGFKTARSGFYGIKRIGLFGSVARGEQQEGSDVDIIYEGEPNLLLRISLKEELEHLFGCKVDVIRMNTQIKASAFGKTIKKDFIYV